MSKENTLKYVFIHQLTESEYIELFRIVSDPQVARWLGNGKPWTPEHLLELRNYSAKDYALPWHKRKYFYWAIIAETDATNARTVIGIIGLHPVMSPLSGLQIMYAIAQTERGHGYAPRAICDIMNIPQIREMRERVPGHERAIWAVISKYNTPSIRAIVKSNSFEQDDANPELVFRGNTYMVFRARS